MPSSFNLIVIAVNKIKVLATIAIVSILSSCAKYTKIDAINKEDPSSYATLSADTQFLYITEINNKKVDDGNTYFIEPDRYLVSPGMTFIKAHFHGYNDQIFNLCVILEAGNYYQATPDRKETGWNIVVKEASGFIYGEQAPFCRSEYF